MSFGKTLLAAILLTLIPGTAQAFALCDEFRKDDAAAAYELKVFIQRNTPFRDVALAERIEIVFAGPDTVFGPYVAEESPFTIRIPRGFRRLSCELVMLTAMMPDHRQVADDIDACLDRRGVLPACLHKILPRYLPAAERAFAARDPGWRRGAGRFPRDTLDFLMLHEFAHILGKDFDRLDEGDDPDRSRQLEFEADLYAARYTTLSYGYPGGGGLIFGLLARQSSAAQQQGSTHDSYFCRLENINNILAVTDLIPNDLFIFPRDRFLAGVPDQDSIIASRRSKLRSIASGGRPLSLARITFSPECRIKALPQLDGARRDLVKLAVFQDSVADRLPGPQDGRSVAAIMARLIDLVMETPDGSAARMKLLAEYADVYRGTWSSEQVTEQIERAMALPDAPDARHADIATLQRELALRILYFSPGLSADDYDKLFHNLLYAMAISGEDPEGYAGLVRLGLLTRKCGLARAAFRAGFTTGLPDIDPALPAKLRAEMTAGGCR